MHLNFINRKYSILFSKTRTTNSFKASFAKI